MKMKEMNILNVPKITANYKLTEYILTINGNRRYIYID